MEYTTYHNIHYPLLIIPVEMAIIISMLNVCILSLEHCDSPFSPQAFCFPSIFRPIYLVSQSKYIYQIIPHKTLNICFYIIVIFIFIFFLRFLQFLLFHLFPFRIFLYSLIYCQFRSCIQKLKFLLELQRLVIVFAKFLFKHDFILNTEKIAV